MNHQIHYTDDEILDIYNRHVDMVYKICLMFLKNLPDTEDAVQEIFLKLMRGNHRFKNLEHEKAWLIVTSQNHCKNILRHWWRKKRTDISKIPEPSYLEDFPHDNIWEQVISLPRRYKMVIYLYYYEGYSTEEISEILEIKSSTIRGQLRTARKRLQIVLEEEMK